MLLWRICPSRESQDAFSGSDASGRWSEPGTRLVYASSSRALAAIEHAVHADPQDGELVVAAGELPGGTSVERVDVATLPDGWDAPQGHPDLPRLGSAWVASGRTAVLDVPSAVVPGERNLLLNPAHPEATALLVRDPEPFRLDPRLARSRRREEVRPEIADGSERRLKREVVSVQRIGGLLAVGVVAVVLLGALGIAYLAVRPSWSVVGMALAAWALVCAVLTVFAATWPALAWARASFRVDDAGLEIRRGVWWREVVRVPRSRVQHTDVSQGPVERTFGLSTLVVHTAGTHHASIHLDGLDQRTAEAIRDFLIAGAEDAV